MQTVRLPLLRGALFIIALAAISILLARGDSPAAATTYNPHNSVSVSDSSPDAAADIQINFSVGLPDSFPNVRTNSSIQFLPRQWGIHTPETDGANAAPIGGYAGTFNALTTLSVFGGPCFYQIPVPFRLIEASTDTSRTTSALETGPLAGHPGGLGYAGQFLNDPETVQPPGDLGLPLRTFNADEMYTTWGGSPGPYVAEQWAYRNMDGLAADGVPRVTPGDIRLTWYKFAGGFNFDNSPGTVVQEGNNDMSFDTDGDGLSDTGNPLYNFSAIYKHDNADGNGQMDPAEGIYKDVDGSGTVSYGDIRMFVYGQDPTNWQPTETVVEDFRLPGGVNRYPDFLNQMIPPSVVGEPLARQIGVQSVLDTTAASVNIVTYRPGQLPGYPATLGYPNVVVVLNPVAPVDIVSINTTSDLCAPLSLTSTNFGVSKDNPTTQADEAGYVRLTNPKSEKDHTFTLITTSQPDADDDGIENMLDSCPLTPNTGQSERDGLGADGDSLDASCDPDPANASQSGSWARLDEDQDTYTNHGDNCSTLANGIQLLDTGYVKAGYFTLYYGVTGDLIGSDNQLDMDGDDIGDACEGAESGGPGAAAANQQCVNASDDDGDGAVNDGCPKDPYNPNPESGAQCSNAVDDDHDGVVNDGCPKFPASNAESGAQCGNATDDDFDGVVNDGCPGVTAYQPAPDLGLPLIGFNANEKHSAYYYDRRPFLSPYRDVDGNGAVSAGDIRMNEITAPASGYPVLEPGVVNAGDWDANQSFMSNYIGWGLFSFSASEKHDDADGNGQMDPGEGVYKDVDGNNVVSNNDIREFTYNGQWGTTVGAPYLQKESGAQCSNAVDDNGNGVVNEGCPTVSNAETGAQCSNATDDDGDGLVNDGCPTVIGYGAAETGDQCNNATDDDADGLVNDGCPAVDPGNVARTAITGHMHTVTLKRSVAIARHGIKLDDLDGPERVALDGSGSYRVALENKSGSAEEIQVALRVVEGCGAVSGPSSVHANGDASVNADFTVDFSGCAAGTYTVQADACHAGDPVPNGFFGAGACPGTSDVPQPPSAQLSFSGATASSEAFGPAYSAAKAIDGLTETLWCTAFEPGVNIQASFSSPVSVDRVNIDNSYFDYGYAFTTGTLSFSNGFSQDVTLSTAAGSFTVPLQSGVEWVKFTATEGGWAGCISELKAFGFIPVAGDTNPLDDAPRSLTVVVGTP